MGEKIGLGKGKKERQGGVIDGTMTD